MVDRVELVLVDQAQQVRELDRDDAVGREQDPEARDEVVQVGNLGEHVVGGDHVRAPALGGQRSWRARRRRTRPGSGRRAPRPPRRRSRPARSRAPECRARRSAAADSRRCSRPRRPGAGRDEPEPLDHRLGVVARVPHPALGVRREVRVLGEDLVGGDVLGELDEEAAARRRARGADRRPPSRRAARARGSSRRAATCRGRRRCGGAPRRRSGRRAATPRRAVTTGSCLGRRHAARPRATSPRPGAGRRPGRRPRAAASGTSPACTASPSKSSKVEPAARYASSQLDGAGLRRPIELELGQRARDLAEVDAVAARVRVAAPGVLDLAAGDRSADDLGELRDLVVLAVGADVERLVVHDAPAAPRASRPSPRRYPVRARAGATASRRSGSGCGRSCTPSRRGC